VREIEGDVEPAEGDRSKELPEHSQAVIQLKLPNYHIRRGDQCIITAHLPVAPSPSPNHTAGP